MNWDRWAFTLDRNTPPWSMDRRHVEMVAAVLHHMRVERAVEIGCLLGRSTVAFHEAKKRGGPLRWVGLCDKEPTPEACRVAGEIANAGVVVETFWNYSGMIPWRAECWIIDGDHSPEGALADYRKAVANGASVIVLHDTSHKQFSGPRVVADLMRADAKWQTWEDNIRREGEETERGLFIAATPKLPEALIDELAALAEKPAP